MPRARIHGMVAPWAPGHHEAVIRLPLTVVTGRTMSPSCWCLCPDPRAKRGSRLTTPSMPPLSPPRRPSHGQGAQGASRQRAPNLDSVLRGLAGTSLPYPSPQNHAPVPDAGRRGADRTPQVLRSQRLVKEGRREASRSSRLATVVRGPVPARIQSTRSVPERGKDGDGRSALECGEPRGAPTAWPRSRNAVRGSYGRGPSERTGMLSSRAATALQACCSVVRAGASCSARSASWSTSTMRATIRIVVHPQDGALGAGGLHEVGEHGLRDRLVAERAAVGPPSRDGGVVDADPARASGDWSTSTMATSIRS